MKETIRTWKHLFKLDPDRPLSDEALEQLCLSGTDAIIVGGSSGVTYDNTVDLLARIRRFVVPCVCEVSNHEAVVPGFDMHFIPMVLNSREARWIVGNHQEAVRHFGAMIDWDRIAAEGYVIMNKQSTAARTTAAQTELDEKDVAAYAKIADQLLGIPIFYIEYSGMFGDMKLVKHVSGVLKQARLFYGGGIDGPEKAEEAAKAADTIVVGNIIYEHLQSALETVKAVR